MAALLLGCLHFDADVSIQGVVLNRVAGSRHERIVRAASSIIAGYRLSVRSRRWTVRFRNVIWGWFRHSSMIGLQSL
jgi:hypothetical protein